MKKLFLLFLCILNVFFMCSCGNNDYSLNVEIESMPNNIDPQLASSEVELMIVRNTFEGLMRYDKDNKLTVGTADSYKVSDDGKTYTFKLKSGLSWSDGTPLTAEDFVFAVKRASSPETKAPYSDLLRNIKGVNSALRQSDSTNNIGVTAVDDTTVKFVLNKPDNSFCEKLTHSVFMPCNEKFFTECKGKYGLSADKMIFNGTYYVRRWNTEQNSLRISANEEYKGSFKAGPSFIVLQQTKEEEKNGKVKRLSDGSTDILKLNFSELKRTDKNSVNISSIYNSTYSIIFNCETEVGANTELIKALSYSTNKEKIKSETPAEFKFTNSIVPSICKVSGETAENVFKNKSVKYDKSTARQMFLNSLRRFSDGTFPSFSLLCVDDPVIKSVITSVVSSWQETNGAYIKIETLPEDELNDRIKSGDYTAAFLPLEAKSDDAYDFLSSFKTGYSGNVINFSNDKFDSIIKESNRNNKSALKNAENILMNKGNIIPICEAPVIYGTSKNILNANFSLFNGIIDLSFATRK